MTKTVKVKNKKVRNLWNAKDEAPPSAEAVTMESETVPNKTLSLRDLLRRFSRGQSVMTLHPNYQTDDEFNADVAKLMTMDETDRQAYLIDLRESNKVTLRTQRELIKKVYESENNIQAAANESVAEPEGAKKATKKKADDS